MVPGSLPSLPLSGGVFKTPTFPVSKVLGAHAFVLCAFLVYLSVFIFLTTRILAHDTPFSVDLSDHGNSTEGTKVELWGRWQGANQIWTVINRNWYVGFHKATSNRGLTLFFRPEDLNSCVLL
jgi:hypothetical protein